LRRLVNQLAVDSTPPDHTLATLQFYPPEPTPSRTRVDFRWRLPREAPVVLTLYDPAGRRVRRLDVAADGPTHADWDGTDAAGQRARAGLFVARLEALGVAIERRVLYLR